MGSIHFNNLGRFFALTFLLVGSSQAATLPLRKSCESGVALKLSAGVTSQGTLLLAEISGVQDPKSFTAEWDGHTTPLWSQSPSAKALHTLIGIDLEKAPGRYEWKVSWLGPQSQPLVCVASVQIVAGKFPIERLKVENQFVHPDPEQQKRAEDDQKKMRAIYDTVTPEVFWKGKFRIPLDNVTTGGNFGRRRVLNGESRSPHAGVDFPSPAGTSVFAAQSGKVVLAENLYYSGNTVVIDHGFGIYTLYAHLSEIDVKAGDFVELSALLGKVGATGRVTGPHLHWGLTVDHARVNGLQIVRRQP